MLLAQSFRHKTEYALTFFFAEFLGKDGPLKIEEAMHLKLTDILTQAAEHLRFPLFDYVSDEGEGKSYIFLVSESYLQSQCALNRLLSHTN